MRIVDKYAISIISLHRYIIHVLKQMYTHIDEDLINYAVWAK
jgi:hypothetical protein